MPWREPEYEGEFPSLGWELVDWWEELFKVPSGELAGEPLKLTDDQISFFVRMYRIDPDSGARRVRRASRRGPKGRGKSPEGALFLAGEFAGPVVFDGWDAYGEPVGRPNPNPWCWAAATAEEQGDNVYEALREMMGEAELPGVDVGKTRIEFEGDAPGKIETVTASAGAREGARITACVMDETHLWFPSRGGDKLARVIRRNLAKTRGVSLEVTNAPLLGERSVAELTLEAADQLQSGLLYDSIEAQWKDTDDPKDPAMRDEVMRALSEAYGDAALDRGGWVDLERMYEEIVDVDTPTEDVLRFYFNLARVSKTRAYDPTKMAPLEAPDRVVEPDVPCLLMFDGARTRDCAVLSAWTIEDVPHHFKVEVWERPTTADGDYEHPRGEIRGAVRDFIDSHDCVMFAYDSSFHELSSMYDEWIDEYGDAADGGIMVGFPTATGKRMQAAILRTQEDMRGGRFTHDNDPQIMAHIHNAITTKNRGGWQTLAKEKDSLKIDGAVTFTFGYELVPQARDMLAERAPKKTGFAFVLGGD